ncbi:hypothetical protein BJX64DRAFT_81617 [Aspergillus heterothallicus]
MEQVTQVQTSGSIIIRQRNWESEGPKSYPMTIQASPGHKIAYLRYRILFSSRQRDGSPGPPESGALSIIPLSLFSFSCLPVVRLYSATYQSFKERCEPRAGARQYSQHRRRPKFSLRRENASIVRHLTCGSLGAVGGLKGDSLELRMDSCSAGIHQPIGRIPSLVREKNLGRYEESHRKCIRDCV